MRRKETLHMIQNLISILLDVSVTYTKVSELERIDFKELMPPAFIMDEIRGSVFGTIFKTMKPAMIYHIIDRFLLQYSVIYDSGEGGEYFTIGPYRTRNFGQEEYDSILKRNGLSQEEYGKVLEWYYGLLPLVDSNKVQPCMTTVAEFLYPEQKIAYKRIVDNPDMPPTMVPPYTASHSDKIMMEYLEEKYRLENMVLKAVEKGNRTEAMHAYKDYRHFEKVSGQYQNRHLIRVKSNALSNNALYRKAAEKGEVHPFYLDNMYHKFFHEISQATSLEALKETDYNMMICYCDLVHKMSLRNHSPIIRQAINYIQINTGGDLSLKEVARAVNVSPNYFSNLFNREMGMALPDFINQIRTDEAVRLFELGTVGVKEAALQCGFNNVNYFSKIFRKQKGMSPTEFIKLCDRKREG